MSGYIFLDRDGTLVRDTGYPHRPEECELLPGVAEGLRQLAAAGWRFAIVTNQSGIGRGYFGESAYRAFQRRLLAELAAQGVEIAGSFFCPHRPDAGCACRKPAPGLLYRARAQLGATLGRSWLIGDRPADAEAALRAGCRGAILVGAPPAQSGADSPQALPDGVRRVRDLPAAAALILQSGGA
ncbi:MAG: HAD family hydrolase [Deltaproteobacteria bacterium]|nr:HAD family hydrolase [Deltaproteobacteria bacterium]